ncbi:MAG: tRNA threonylcarbamoyladenosine dehydratase [Crocinitomicaceae bacterium]
MSDWLERTELLVGEEAINNLKKSHVLISGLGGVGSYAGEFIVRSGVGTITIIDGDEFDLTNINRQLLAMHSTIGKSKAEELAKKMLDINPEVKLNILKEFVQLERVEEILNLYQPDYVIDCIDSISPKVTWMIACKRNKIKIISAMGAGGKVNPAKVVVKDISKVINCKMGKHIRKRLKKENINKGIKAVFSSELQLKESLKMTDGSNYKKSFYGTASYIPALFGLYAAAEVIKYLSEKK